MNGAIETDKLVIAITGAIVKNTDATPDTVPWQVSSLFCLLYACYLLIICVLFAYYLRVICLLFACYSRFICLIFAYIEKINYQVNFGLQQRRP